MLTEIKNKVNILDLVKTLGLPVSRSGFIPSIYKEENNPSLKIYPETNSYYCFSTDQGGDVIKFYMDYNHLSYRQALKELSELFCATFTNRSAPNGFVNENRSAVRRYKKHTLKLLESEEEYFEERAAIIEYEGGIPKSKAEGIVILKSFYKKSRVFPQPIGFLLQRQKNTEMSHFEN